MHFHTQHLAQSFDQQIRVISAEENKENQHTWEVLIFCFSYHHQILKPFNTLEETLVTKVVFSSRHYHMQFTPHHGTQLTLQLLWEHIPTSSASVYINLGQQPPLLDTALLASHQFYFLRAPGLHNIREKLILAVMRNLNRFQKLPVIMLQYHFPHFQVSSSLLHGPYGCRLGIWLMGTACRSPLWFSSSSYSR